MASTDGARYLVHLDYVQIQLRRLEKRKYRISPRQRGDRKQAELSAKGKSLEETANKPVRVASHRWEEWSTLWINGRRETGVTGRRRCTQIISGAGWYILRKLMLRSQSHSDAKMFSII
jgi:hypothetical protein